MIAIAPRPAPLHLAGAAKRRADAKFLQLLPAIRRQAQRAFRRVRRERREELLAEVIANAYCALVRLAQRGRLHAAFATPLAAFAIKHVRAGRQVGGRLNVKDVTSRYCQYRKQLTLERLDDWRELVVEDRHAGPADTAAARLDVAAWLSRLPARNRRIAQALAVGERTREVAGRFGLSPARISQLRSELARSWALFQEEREGAAAAPAAPPPAEIARR